MKSNEVVEIDFVSNFFYYFSVHPAQNSLDHGHNILSNDSPFSDDDDPFGQEKDPLTTALEDGSDIWEDK